jgi:hypothetical protein
MGNKWTAARHCHEVLDVLVADLRIQFGPDTNSAAELHNGHSRSSLGRRRMRQAQAPSDAESSKRQKLSNREGTGVDEIELEIPQNQQHGAHVFNPLPGAHLPLELEQFNELEWLQDPALEGMVPDIQDIFGYLSWESLFQGDGTDTYLWPGNSNSGLGFGGT